MLALMRLKSLSSRRRLAISEKLLSRLYSSAVIFLGFVSKMHLQRRFDCLLQADHESFSQSLTIQC